MTRKLYILTLALAVAALPVGAQTTPARERARAALPPEVFERIETIAGDAAREGLPTEPLWDKALEGAAKRVPARCQTLRSIVIHPLFE